MSTTEKTLSKAEQRDAARNRADYIRALTEELEGLKAQGKTERAEAVEAELARLQAGPKGRRTARKSTAAPGEPPAPDGDADGS